VVLAHGAGCSTTLCTRGKYLEIKEDAYELSYDILTFLPGEFRSAELKKEKNRGEKEFRASDKIIPSVTIITNLSISKPFIIIILSINISSISNSRIF
jgi:hypothetical protein